MWAEVLARFEENAPTTVMTRAILEQAISAEWVDQMFKEHRQRQYPREILFSTIVELMSLVSLGLRPSLHQPCEDAYASERVSVLPLLEKACAGQLWMADRLYCTLPVMEACEKSGASFIVREQSKHPRLLKEGDWQEPIPVAAGSVL